MQKGVSFPACGRICQKRVLKCTKCFDFKGLAIPKIPITYLNINFGRGFAGKIEEANYLIGDFIG